MSTVTIFGPPPSSYLRSVRMTCREKGVDYDIEPVSFGSEAHRKLHPYLKVPSFRHEDVHLFETAAICKYVDAAFEGPSLVPSDVADHARMDQWISVIDCYAYTNIMRNCALRFIIPTLGGEPPDVAGFEDGLPKAREDLALLDAAYAGNDWIAGSFSLADIIIGPVISTLAAIPPGQPVVAEYANLSALLGRLRERPCGSLLDPPRG